MRDPNDIYVWADGTYCSGFELHEMNHMTDDYIILETDSEEWLAFDPENPLKRWEP